MLGGAAGGRSARAARARRRARRGDETRVRGVRRCGERLAQRARHRVAGAEPRPAVRIAEAWEQAQPSPRATSKILQSRAKAAGFRRVRLACRGSHARLIPSIPAMRRTLVRHDRRSPAITSPPRSPIRTARRISATPMRSIATDAIARFMRLDGYDVFFLTGTDEHGIKMLQTAAQGRHHAARTGRAQRAALPGDGRALLNCSNDDFIRTTEERHHASSQAIWERMEANGDIYLSKYAGWYSVRDEAYYDENETRLDQNGTRLGPQGTPVEWVEEESYFFKLSAYQDKLLDLYARRAGLRAAEGAAERGRELRARRAAGSVDLAHHVRLGHAGAGRPEARHVCVGRRADQLHHRRSAFPDTESDNVQALLAGRPACDRQGHRALPRGLLAGLPDVGRHRGAAAHLLPRLPVQPRREDVEVGRQRGRSVRARRRLRRRSAALFLPARSAVRAGRQLQPRGDRQPHQRRPRQRSRQPGAALAVDDRQAARRRAADAGRVHATTTRRSWPPPTP